MDSMYTVFLIGNIASGKSTAARYLERSGAWRIDLDELAKSLYEPGSDVVDELAHTFGYQILDEDGGIIPAALAHAAFCDDDHTAQLNAIVHPRVKERLAHMLVPPVCCCATGPTYELAVVEISVPQAFTDVFDLADEVLAISAPLDLRRARALGRGMDADDFDARAAVQPTEDELCALADTVIENMGDAAGLQRSLDAWLAHHGLLQLQPAQPRGMRP